MNIEKIQLPNKETFQWIIRNVELEDAANIVRIQKSAWLDTYTSEIITEEMLLRILENNRNMETQIISMKDFIQTSLVENPDKIIKIVEDKDNGLVGYCFLVPQKKYIWAFYIDPDFHRKGVGAKLMLEVLDTLKSKENELWLAVSTRNERAIKFYSKFGFVVDNVTKLEDFHVGNNESGNSVFDPQSKMIRPAGPLTF